MKLEKVVEIINKLYADVAGNTKIYTNFELHDNDIADCQKITITIDQVNH